MYAHHASMHNVFYENVWITCIPFFFFFTNMSKHPCFHTLWAQASVEPGDKETLLTLLRDSASWGSSGSVYVTFSAGILTFIWMLCWKLHLYLLFHTNFAGNKCYKWMKVLLQIFCMSLYCIGIYECVTPLTNEMLEILQWIAISKA